MFEIGDVAARNCGISRRGLIEIGGAGMAGLSLASALRAEAGTSATREKSCIFLWLDGGPSHFETFDPKPDAPLGQRGPYQPMETSVPGVRFCELIPMLSERAKHFTVIRSMAHGIDSHSP